MRRMLSGLVWGGLFMAWLMPGSVQAWVVDNQPHEEVHEDVTNIVVHTLGWAVHCVNTGHGGRISFDLPEGYTYNNGIDILENVEIRGDTGIVFNCCINCDKNLEAYDIYGAAYLNCGRMATVDGGAFNNLSVENAAIVKNAKMGGAGVGAFSTITNCDIGGLELQTGCELQDVRMAFLTASNGVTMKGCVFTNDRSWARIYSPAELDMRFCGTVLSGNDSGRNIYLYDCAEDFTIANQSWTNVNVEVFSGDVIFRSNVLFDVLGQFVDGIEFHDCDVMGRTRLYGGKDHQMKGCNVSGQACFYNCTNVVVGRESLGNCFVADAMNDDGWLVMTNCVGGAVEGNQFGKNASGQSGKSYGMWLNHCSGVSVLKNGWHTNQLLDVTYNNSFYVEGCSNITVQGNSVSNCPGMTFYNTQHSLVGGDGAEEFRNYMTGCDKGIMLWGGSHDITIQNNYIGLKPDGSRAGNTRGVYVYDSYDILIGGSNDSTFVQFAADGLQNVISDNKEAGVYIEKSTNILVQGNLIGTDPTGEYGRGNEGHGVVLGAYATACWVGGDVQSYGNIISGNASNGVFIADYACSNLVRNNGIGVDVVGEGRIANSMHGIAFANRASHSVSNVIGGSYQRGGMGPDQGCVLSGFNHFQGNVISGNSTNGLVLGGVGTGVYGNYFGVDVSGTNKKDNGACGVYCLDTAEGCEIGKEAVDAGMFYSNEFRNIISGNWGSGMLLQGTRMEVYDNYIGLGFDGHVVNNQENGLEIGNTLMTRVEHNWIAGNSKNGVFVSSLSGTAPRIGGNRGDGDANYIYGNGECGVLVSNGAVNLEGNDIGVEPDNRNISPNGVNYQISVIDLSDTDAVDIGGETADNRNVIFCGDYTDQELIHVENSRSYSFDIGYNDCNYDREYPWVHSTSRYCVAVYGSANGAMGLNNGRCSMVMSTGAALYVSSCTNMQFFNSEAGTTNIQFFNNNHLRNFGHGMVFENCQHMQVGDMTMGNTIAANAGDGIRCVQAGQMVTNTGFGTIAGNRIGCGALTNGGQGIYLDNVYGTVIGAGDAGALSGANIIGGNGGSGVLGNGVCALSFRGNRIGLDAAGTAYPNNGDGITLRNALEVEVGSLQSNVFQGVNYLSGNAGCGMAMTNSHLTTIVGAVVGLNDADAAVPNGSHGVALYNCGTNIVTETLAGAPCVISGNDQDGIYIEGEGSTDNLIASALIGLKASGGAVAGNGGCGVRIHGAADNSVGSENDPGGVVIGGNMLGVRISGVHKGANIVQNCLIGMTTNAAMGNLNNGIVIETSGQVIGGERGDQGNYIGANGENGIFMANVSNVVVRNNTFGFGPNPAFRRGNWENGVLLTNCGGCVVMTNEIANNTNGIVAQAGQANLFLGNSIYSNTLKGIALTDGANNGITAPVLQDAWASGAIHSNAMVKLSYAGQPNTPYTFQFFSSEGTNAYGRPQGRSNLATRVLTTGADGIYSNTVALVTDLPTGRWVTATATLATNGTSEFSNGKRAQGSAGTQTINFTSIPDQVTTSTVTLVATASSGLPVTFDVVSGPGDLNSGVELRFTGSGTVVVRATQAGNMEYAPAYATNSITVIKAQQAALVFNPSSPQGYQTTNTLSVSGGSGSGAVSYSISAGPGSIEGGDKLVVTAPTGQITVVASKASDDLYFATATTAMVTACKNAQTIQFAPIADQSLDGSVGLSATASSGLAVTFDVQGLAQRVGDTLTFTATGVVSVTASQAGNEFYSAASVTNAFNVLPLLASMTLPQAESVEMNTITVQSDVVNDGGAPVTQRGICWSVGGTPVIAGQHTVDGTGTGTYESVARALSKGTTYAVRSYAVNDAGVAYSAQISVTTSNQTPVPVIPDYTWTAGDGDWDTATNWSGVVAPGSTNEAVFYAGANRDIAVDLQGTQVVGRLCITTNADGFVNLNNGTLVLTNADSAIAQENGILNLDRLILGDSTALNNKGGSTTYCKHGLETLGTVAKEGSGRLYLYEQNLFGGDFVLRGGDVHLLSGLSFASTGKLDVGAGAMLNVPARSTFIPITNTVPGSVALNLNGDLDIPGVSGFDLHQNGLVLGSQSSIKINTFGNKLDVGTRYTVAVFSNLNGRFSWVNGLTTHTLQYNDQSITLEPSASWKEESDGNWSDTNLWIGSHFDLPEPEEDVGFPLNGGRIAIVLDVNPSVRSVRAAMIVNNQTRSSTLRSDSGVGGVWLNGPTNRMILTNSEVLNGTLPAIQSDNTLFVLNCDVETGPGAHFTALGTGGVIRVLGAVRTQPGQGNLILDGEGCIELLGANTFGSSSNRVVINGARLLIRESANLGHPDVGIAFTNDGTLLLRNSMSGFNRPMTFAGNGAIQIESNATVELLGNLSGPGCLTRRGDGDLVMRGSSNELGGVELEGGRLRVEGRLESSGDVNVGEGGVLGGNGSIRLSNSTDLLQVNGGTVSPGASVGTLTIEGSVALNGMYDCELENNTCDRLIVRDTLMLGTSSTLRVIGAADGTTRYEFATYSSRSGEFGSFTIPQQYTLVYSETNLVLEPGGGELGTTNTVREGGSVTLAVEVSSNTAWTAVSASGWVTVTSGESGIGAGTVKLTIAANSGMKRETTVWIAGRQYVVKQAGNRSVYLDFDGDCKADIAVYWPEMGYWYILQSATSTELIQVWGWADAQPVPGDYDGDGKTDVAVYSDEYGMWYIQESGTGTERLQSWGAPGYEPVQADYDGDGKTDVAVFDAANGIWHILQSSDSRNSTQAWGWSETVPVPGDYDGDGKADCAVYWAAGGQWYILQSASGTGRTQPWGWAAAEACQGDYDGDGKTDVGVYWPETGWWNILQSFDGALMTQNWGWSEAWPVAADYDGDGKFDVTVYAPTAGMWYLWQSQSQKQILQPWGWSEAEPVN